MAKVITKAKEGKLISPEEIEKQSLKRQIIVNMTSQIAAVNYGSNPSDIVEYAKSVTDELIKHI